MSAQSTLALTGTYNGYSSGSITATPAPFTLLGGRYILTAAAGTFPTSLELDQLSSDGTTYVKVLPILGTNPLIANAQIIVDLPYGTFRLTVVNTTQAVALFVDITRVPNRTI